MAQDCNAKVFRIELSGTDKETVEKLFGDAELKWGQEFRPMPGVTGINKTEDQRGMIDFQQVVDFTVTFTEGIAGNLIASWLYDCIKDKVKALRLNGKPTEVDKQAIAAALNEAYGSGTKSP